MTIFCWGHRKHTNHSSPGGYCSGKRHPSKLFHASQYGDLLVDLLFQVLFPHLLKSIERPPPTQQGEKREICTMKEVGKRCAGRSMTRDRVHLTGVLTPGCLPGSWEPVLAEPGQLLLCPDRGACLPLSSLNHSDHISSSYHGILSIQLTPDCPTLICPNSDVLGGSMQCSTLPAPSVSYLPSLVEDAGITSWLLLTTSDTGRKAPLLQISFTRAWWFHIYHWENLLWLVLSADLSTKVQDFSITSRNSITVTWGKKLHKTKQITKIMFKHEFNRADLFKAYRVKVLQHTTVCIYLRMQCKVYWSSLDFKVTWLGNQSQCLFFSFF